MSNPDTTLPETSVQMDVYECIQVAVTGADGRGWRVDGFSWYSKELRDGTTFTVHYWRPNGR